MLHLQCDLPAELRPLLASWWEDFHFPELLTLPGFLDARRGELIAPEGQAPIVTMYGLAEPAAADQPRPPEFTLMPRELDGKVTFKRRILRRVSPMRAGIEPVATSFLQLLRPAPDHDEGELHQVAERVRRWSGVRSVSCWQTVLNKPHTDRVEVVHLRDTDLIHAELTAGHALAAELVSRAAEELSDWDATAYRQTFPTPGIDAPARH